MTYVQFARTLILSSLVGAAFGLGSSRFGAGLSWGSASGGPRESVQSLRRGAERGWRRTSGRRIEVIENSCGQRTQFGLGWLPAHTYSS